MDCTLCGSPLAGSKTCRVCGTAVTLAHGMSSPPPVAAEFGQVIANREAAADAVIARALGATGAARGPASRRWGATSDLAALLARASARVQELPALPQPSGLPGMQRDTLLMKAGAGLALRVEGPRRGRSGRLQLHYASLHCGEAFPHRLELRNEDFLRVEGVIVTLTIPRYSEPWRRTVSRLERSAPLVFEDVCLDLKLDRLRVLVEADTHAQLDIRVEAGGRLRHAESVPIEILAWGEWRYDLTERPESLACFVQPNDPQIAAILSSAATHLREVTGDSSLCGYQKPASAHWPLMMTVALHHALQAAEVRYINPPASFERGQKIRLAAEVLRGRMGTCLDLAVLWCSLIEAVGLHPVLVVVDGHAFQGVWLEEVCLAEPWTDELEPVVAALAEGRLLLFNSTTFTDGTSGLDLAIDQAIDCLANVPFRCLVDIRRSRGTGVRPLP